MARANRFGAPSSTPLDAVNDAILCFAQIETLEAVACVEEIAEVDGVDVLFLGPTDLSHAMGTSFHSRRPIAGSGRRRVLVFFHPRTAGGPRYRGHSVRQQDRRS